ncbi:hypothetical protein EST38_g11335 [Candolleomyces aberdarensis]|uniref:Uncharacterized protein n=1 Tax=Candolleomyces aberdarensis TaxID=2316362 RepID=A0A4Q2D556_9AGAR|nr:hypothetical protein EST38_g11335 [Candolleomyces aberdarensis]
MSHDHDAHSHASAAPRYHKQGRMSSHNGSPALDVKVLHALQDDDHATFTSCLELGEHTNKTDTLPTSPSPSSFGAHLDAIERYLSQPVDIWHEYTHCSNISPKDFAVVCPITGAAEMSDKVCNALVPFNELADHIAWNHISPHAHTVRVNDLPAINRWTCPLPKLQPLADKTMAPGRCGEIIDLFKTDFREECDGPVVMANVLEILHHLCSVHGQWLEGSAIEWKPNGTMNWCFPASPVIAPLPKPKCKYCSVSLGEPLGSALDLLVVHVKNFHPERVQGVQL